ncbi:MAG TPA: hypothetical protein VJK48_06590 [Chlamydiales bacterium]|nr:MAG: hypothetical protein A3F67_11685 [Verrucomicrobia bacterium RIFCSPHIGHO2_12_FULL_41_10]HLB53354.1 hypothetical protein [Chlamydiales bacterium]
MTIHTIFDRKDQSKPPAVVPPSERRRGIHTLRDFEKIDREKAEKANASAKATMEQFSKALSDARETLASIPADAHLKMQEELRMYYEEHQKTQESIRRSEKVLAQFEEDNNSSVFSMIYSGFSSCFSFVFSSFSFFVSFVPRFFSFLRRWI